MGDEGQEAVSRSCRTLVWTLSWLCWIPDLLIYARMTPTLGIYVHVSATQPHDVQTTNVLFSRLSGVFCFGPSPHVYGSIA